MESKNFFFKNIFPAFPCPCAAICTPPFCRVFFCPFAGVFVDCFPYLCMGMDDIEEIIFDESLDEEDENYYNGSYDDNRNDNNPQDNRPDGGTGCLGIVSAIVIMILLLSLLL